MVDNHAIIAATSSGNHDTAASTMRAFGSSTDKMSPAFGRRFFLARFLRRLGQSALPAGQWPADKFVQAPGLKQS